MKPMPGSDSKSIREWMEYHKQSSGGQNWKDLVKANLRKSGFRVLWRMRDIYSAVVQWGPSVRAEQGVSLMRQFVRLCRFMHNSYGQPEHYYILLMRLGELPNNPDNYVFTNKWPLHNAILSHFDMEPLKDKHAFFIVARENGIPTPTLFLKIEDGNTVPVSITDRQLPRKSLFVKAQKGSFGRAAEKWIYKEGIYVNNHKEHYTASLINYLEEQSLSESPLIVQQCLAHHALWASFTPGGLPTARIVTGNDPYAGVPECIAASFRMPTGSSDIDNFSAGGIASAIEIDTGFLGPAVQKKTDDGRLLHSKHPDTGAQLEGSRLPKWPELLSLAKRAHRAFDLPFIGWDVSLTTEGPMVLEGNHAWDMDLVELPQSRPLDDTQFPEMYSAWMEHLGIGD